MDLSRVKYFLLFLLFVFLADIIRAGEFKEKLGLGFNANVQKLYGDFRTGQFVFGVNPAVMRYNFNSNGFLDADVSLAHLWSSTGTATLKTNMINLGFKLGYRLVPQYKINPFLYLGTGIFNFQLGDWSRYWDAYGAVGGGLELFLLNNLGLNLTGDLRYTTGDDFDGHSGGSRKDAILNLGFGFIFYLGGREGFITGPQFTKTTIEEPSPYEEVFENQERLEKKVEKHESTVALANLAAEKEELLKIKRNKEDAIELMRLKLKISQNQIKELEQQLFELNNYKGTVAPYYQNRYHDYFMAHYRTGLAYFQDGNYTEAINAFRNLLNENPEGTLADLCLFWLGESYYASQDYDSAIEAYQEVLREANSLKKEVALLMLGLSRWKKGDVSGAKSDFMKLLESFPHSDCAPLAKQYLAQISS